MNYIILENGKEIYEGTYHQCELNVNKLKTINKSNIYSIVPKNQAVDLWKEQWNN